MSKEPEKYKGTGRSTIGRLAGTVHPGDSASQISSNLLYEEGQEAGGDAAKRIAATKARQEAKDAQSKVSTNSRALMAPGGSSRMKPSVSRASSARSGSGLMIEDITPDVSSSVGGKSSMSRNSKAIVPVNKALEAVAGSSVSRASSSKSSSRDSSSGSAAGDGTLDASSKVSKASPSKGSAISKASSAKSLAAPKSSVSRASGGDQKQLAIEGPSSQVSRASSNKSARSLASASKADKSTVSSATESKSSVSSASNSNVSPSQVSKASSDRSNDKSSVSSSSRSSSKVSGRNRALVPAGQATVKASPLRNEVRPEDLNDDMYSISIHERGVLQEMPSRAEMLEIILKENPHLDIDEASAIADNHIATSSAIGRSQITGSIAPASVISRAERTAVSKASAAKGKEVLRASGGSTISAASSSRSKGLELVQPSSVILAATAKPSSSVSKASSYYGKEIAKAVAPSTISKASSSWSKTVKPIKAPSAVSTASARPAPSHVSKAPSYYDQEAFPESMHTPSEVSAAPLPLTRSNTAPASSFDSLTLANFGSSAGSSLTTFKMPDTANEIATSDLLALAQLRQQGDARRAQALKVLQAQHESAGSDLARKRMIELEIAKQALADTQLESQMQEFIIQNSKLTDLQRHAHEDKVAALERAQEAENRRKANSMIDAIRDRSATEKARNRDRRGDIARAEREREDERNSQLQKEYERMDRERTNETMDTWERLVESSRPRDVPQPRRTGLNLEHSHQYRNPQTGGDGTINMRIHKGCKGKGDGDGVCPKCGLEFVEHPVQQQRDGSIITRTGQRIMPGEKGNRPDDSTVSKGSSSRRKR